VNGGVPALNNEPGKSGKVQFANGQSQQAGGSFYNKSLTKNAQKTKGKSVDKKKVLPTKKFPELKLMINGEYRNGNNTLSSEDEMSLAVSLLGSNPFSFHRSRKFSRTTRILLMSP